MKFQTHLIALAACVCLTAPISAEVDRATLYKHLPKALPFPPGVEFELKDLKPSPIPGFLSGTLEGRYKGHAQNWPIQISQDGRYYILSEAFSLRPSNIPGLLSPAPADSSAPQVHVTRDGSRYLVGELLDTSIDPDKANMSKINLGGHPFRGTAGASVVVVEYSDLQCPYCRNAHQILEKQLLSAYGTKIRWYFKHNPLNIHPYAYSAAIAAACASRINPQAGWSVEAAFFKAQPSPSLPVKAQQAAEEEMAKNIRAKSIEFAQQAGLDKTRFAACFDTQGSKDIVEADRQEAAALHLDSTPSFLVNGRIVRGFRDFETLKAVIDEMLTVN